MLLYEDKFFRVTARQFKRSSLSGKDAEIGKRARRKALEKAARTHTELVERRDRANDELVRDACMHERTLTHSLTHSLTHNGGRLWCHKKSSLSFFFQITTHLSPSVSSALAIINHLSHRPLTQ